MEKQERSWKFLEWPHPMQSEGLQYMQQRPRRPSIGRKILAILAKIEHPNHFSQEGILGSEKNSIKEIIGQQLPVKTRFIEKNLSFNFFSICHQRQETKLIAPKSRIEYNKETAYFNNKSHKCENLNVW